MPGKTGNFRKKAGGIQAACFKGGEPPTLFAVGNCQVLL
jgi:hypothetical protein